jgi:predicted CXXCH cytochrome family protein
MRTKLTPVAILILFAYLLACSVDAEAVPGQTYRGDGAVNNTTVPPGGWTTVSPSDSWCFNCHNGTSERDKTGYLNTGHKNALRKIVTPAAALTGPDGNAYTTDLSGNAFNWTDNTLAISGYCTNILYADETSCSNNGGAWISGSKSLYYIVNGWLSSPANPSALYDGRYTQGGQKTAVSFSCARCHTTGFKMSSSITTTLPPESSFPGISWTPTVTTGRIDFDPDGDGLAAASSWALSIPSSGSKSLEGVQCERCHNYSGAHFTSAIRGASSTALCLQCHRQEHTTHYTSGAMGSNIKPTPYSDNNPVLPASEPVYALPAIEVGGAGGYAPQFYGYSTGMEFLNSVHAKFTGNFSQISTPANYSSAFSYGRCSLDGLGYAPDLDTCTLTGGTWTGASRGCLFDQTNCENNFGEWTVFQGGCTTCHDVHESIASAVNATAPFRNKCPDCHISESNMAGIKHPQGTGTPLGDLTDIPAACAKCHMPKPNNGAGYASHVWRISTNASYTTFPTQSQWDAGTKTALSAPSGAYTNAVWIDVDLACGQCHNGSGPAQHYFSKTALANRAAGMHAGSPWPTSCTGCHSGGGDPTAAQVNQGVDHHTGVCETCHTQPGRSQFGSSNESCLICHSTTPAGTTLQSVIPGTNHHSGACMTCHTAPGIATLTPANSSCLSCHNVAQGSKQAVDPAKLNHPTYFTTTPNNCATCHTEPGVAVSVIGIQTVCGQCHGGSSPITHNGAPYKTLEVLIAIAGNMHQNNKAPVVQSTHSAGTAAFAGATAYSVSLTDASTDPDLTSNTVTVNWGDGTISSLSSGATFTHTYTRGKTYKIFHSVTDGMLSSSESFTVSVPQKFSVSGSVSTGAGTYLSLKKGGHTVKAMKATGGTYTFGNVVPGDYTIKAYKRGVTFTTNADVISVTTGTATKNIL